MTDAYQPGDVANGHMLGSDGVWRPVISGPPPQQVVMRMDPSGYWARYLRRWFFTVLAVAIGLYLLTMVSAGVTQVGLGTGIVSFLCFGIPAGSVLNFGVAAIPTKSRPLQP